MSSITNSASSTSKKRKAALQSQTKIHQNQDQKCEEDHKSITIPYLPTPIVFEILSRVPIKTLFYCLLVCKTWFAHISTSEFAQQHLSRSPSSCLIKCLNRKRHSRRVHLFVPESPYCPSNKLLFIPKINLPNVPTGLINSCNGLACLCQLISPDSNEACNIYICNPVLREYITLPKPARAINFDSDDCAFGFSHNTNQYKVVLRYYNSGKYWTKIYTLGESSWRSIGSASYCIRNRNFNAFLNGALHWIVNDLSLECPFIGSFDFESEQFRAVPEPSEFDPTDREYSHQMRLGVICGNLSICDFNYCNFDYEVGNNIVTWVMKDYGVKESWNKDFVITHKNCSGFDTYEPIMRKGNGEILVIFNNEYIKLYDPKSEAFESELEINGVSSEFHAIAYVPSLISLKDVSKSENLKGNVKVSEETEKGYKMV